jgi:hypothetical protein
LSARAVKRDHNQVFGAGVGSQLTGGLPSVDAWHREVHQGELRQMFASERDRFGALAGDEDREPAECQVVCEKFSTVGKSSTIRTDGGLWGKSSVYLRGSIAPVDRLWSNGALRS